MQGLADLAKSERGIFCLLALACATALVILGRIDGAAWIEFNKWLVGALVASKTATSIVNTRVFNKAEPSEVEVPRAKASFRGEGNPEP